MKATRWLGEKSTRNLLQEEPELGYTKNPERMTLNLVIIVFWHVGFVHPIPDGFCADKKTTLDWVSCYTQERWFWRAFGNGAKLRCDYRVFSLSWPASMRIYWNKRKRLHNKRFQLPQDWFGTPTWPPFHGFGTPIWPPWRHVKTLHMCFTYRIVSVPHFEQVFWP